MAPLSIVPGRIRFENRTLFGDCDQCARLEQLVASWPEVREVTANHRTGRLLIRFDETAISREDLTLGIAACLATKEGCLRPQGSAVAVPQPPLREQSARTSGTSGRLLRDMVMHAILPSPLDLLLPTALAVLRK